MDRGIRFRAILKGLTRNCASPFVLRWSSWFAWRGRTGYARAHVHDKGTQAGCKKRHQFSRFHS
ncbi:MAG: hypothetical protein DMF30_08340, partial [Verrucomicrobia bacterium]